LSPLPTLSQYLRTQRTRRSFSLCSSHFILAKEGHVPPSRRVSVFSSPVQLHHGTSCYKQPATPDCARWTECPFFCLSIRFPYESYPLFGGPATCKSRPPHPRGLVMSRCSTLLPFELWPPLCVGDFVAILSVFCVPSSPSGILPSQTVLLPPEWRSSGRFFPLRPLPRDLSLSKQWCKGIYDPPCPAVHLIFQAPPTSRRCARRFWCVKKHRFSPLLPPPPGVWCSHTVVFPKSSLLTPSPDTYVSFPFSPAFPPRTHDRASFCDGFFLSSSG